MSFIYNHQYNQSKKKSKWYQIRTGLLCTYVLEILEVLRQTIHAAFLPCVLSAQVFVYESRGIYHEQGMPAEFHVLSKRTKCRSVPWPSQSRCIAAFSKTYVVVSRYIVHRDRRRSGEDRVKTPDIFLISTNRAPCRAVPRSVAGRKGEATLSLREESGKLHALVDMHVGKTVVHHISEEDDCVWTFALRDAPRLAQIHVDEDPGHGP